MPDNNDLWVDVARGDVGGWNERNELFAKFIPAGSKVLDVGCGNQNLRDYLDPSCEYAGIDTVDVHGTPIVDFNAKICPELPGRYDFAVISGVLEYPHFPSDAVCICARWAPVMLFSYQPLESRPKLHRETPPDLRVWKSTSTKKEFEDNIRARAKKFETIGRFRTQNLYRAEIGL